MPTPPFTRAACMEAVRAVAELVASGDYFLDLREKPGQVSAVQEASRRLGLHHTGVRARLDTARRLYGVGPEDVVQEMQPTPEELESLPDGAEVLRRHAAANLDYIEKARRSKVRIVPVRKAPFARAFIGDPHVDNKGANLSKLYDDLTLCRDAGIPCINMGDMLDNFHHRGKLAAKQAQNRMSIAEGHAVARYIIRDMGVKWDAHLIGNHDAWANAEGGEMFQQWARAAGSRFYNWWCHLVYDWGDGRFSVQCAHDFKGASIYNPLHGLQRRAREEGLADLYVAGHRHHAAKGDAPSPERDRHYWHMRVAGYKEWDSYADEKMFGQGNEGHSGLAVIDPCSETQSGRCRLFHDLAEGVAHLQALRQREAA